jgi:hypothetical protein
MGLDLDAISRRAADAAADEDAYFTRQDVLTVDVPALVAEVRHLRALTDVSTAELLRTVEALNAHGIVLPDGRAEHTPRPDEGTEDGIEPPLREHSAPPAAPLGQLALPRTTTRGGPRRGPRRPRRPEGVAMSELDLDAIEARARPSATVNSLIAVAREDVPALVAEVRRLRDALDVIAGEDGTYLQSLKMTDTEYTMRTIARDALGRK